MARVRSEQEKRRTAERAKEWYQDPANKERAKAWKAERLAKDPAKAKRLQREYSAAWRERNPEKRRLVWIKNKYRLTEEQAQRILTDRGMCESCGTEKATQIDHCHTTGRFRGQLCGGCNRAAGMLNDDPVKAIALAAYLTRVSEELRQAAAAQS